MLRDNFRTPDAREARNEQRKLRAGVANAFAIAVGAVALFGDLLNPSAAALLTPISRAGLLLLAWTFHLFAAWLVRDIEDK